MNGDDDGNGDDDVLNNEMLKAKIRTNEQNNFAKPATTVHGELSVEGSVGNNNNEN